MAQSAKQIYEDLIKRIKEKVKKEECVVYDPETGIQKTFLRGKLLYVKKFTPQSKRNKPDDSVPM